MPISVDRRRSPRRRERHEALLQADMSLLDSGLNEGESDYPLSLYGSTQDISVTGLSLVVPLFPIDEKFCAEADQVLSLVLYLPFGTVEMQVTLVRCLPLDENQPGQGYFIAAQIREMESGEKERFVRYLN